jgi:hypothetical protein
MMCVIRHAVLLFAMLALTACGEILPPFGTIPPALPKGQTETVTRTAVCYNGLLASDDRVRAIAVEDCGPDTMPERIDWDFNLQNCPLFMPTRATFACNKP